jgi:50S ribosomal subunit-associated GTPase HflX
MTTDVDAAATMWDQVQRGMPFYLTESDARMIVNRVISLERDLERLRRARTSDQAETAKDT